MRRSVRVHVWAEVREYDGREGCLVFPRDEKVPEFVQADAQLQVAPDMLATLWVCHREDRVQFRGWGGGVHRKLPGCVACAALCSVAMPVLPLSERNQNPTLS